ncbi:hypothetical protein LINGRAHAP2_LOCUS35284 [Linum grandiflorum]
MGCNLLGPWVFDGYGSNLIRWLPFQFFRRVHSWIINIFTVKLIMLRTIWPILVILSLMDCIFLILQIGVCPTGFTMIL